MAYEFGIELCDSSFLVGLLLLLLVFNFLPVGYYTWIPSSRFIVSFNDDISTMVSLLNHYRVMTILDVKS